MERVVGCQAVGGVGHELGERVGDDGVREVAERRVRSARGERTQGHSESERGRQT